MPIFYPSFASWRIIFCVCFCVAENLKRPCVQKPRYTGQPTVIFSNDVNTRKHHQHNNNNNNNNNDGNYDINPQSNLRLQQSGGSSALRPPSHLQLAFTFLYFLSRIGAYVRHHHS